MDCKVKEVSDRVKHLHPILYQHSKNAIPRNITCQFAQGIVYEHFLKKEVNWAKFGQQTNNLQRERYQSDMAKIEWARSQGMKSTLKS